jgi:hypothetical protein
MPRFVSRHEPTSFAHRHPNYRRIHDLWYRQLELERRDVVVLLPPSCVDIANELCQSEMTVVSAKMQILHDKSMRISVSLFWPTILPDVVASSVTKSC